MAIGSGLSGMRGSNAKTNRRGDLDPFAGVGEHSRTRIDTEEDYVITVLIRDQQPVSRWIDHEIARCPSHRGLKTFIGQTAGGGVDGKDGEAVGVATVGRIEESSVGGDMNIGAADVAYISGRMRGNMLQRRESSIGVMKGIYSPAQLVDDICEGFTGIEAAVTRTDSRLQMDG